MKKILTVFFWHFCTGGLAFGVFGGFVSSLGWKMKLVYLIGYCFINAILFVAFKKLTDGKQLLRKS